MKQELNYPLYQKYNYQTYFLQEEKLSGVPLLVFANKQDLISAMSAAEISTALQLDNIRERTWQIQACSAKTGEGLQAGMEWLVREANKRTA